MPNSSSRNEAKKLLAQLRDDLEAKVSSNAQLQAALEGLKVLGRDASNVSALYNESGVKILGYYAFGVYPPDIRQESLRCIANALLLLPITRQHSISLELDKKATHALEDASVDEEFLLSRILFLLTYDPRIDLRILLDEHRLAENIIKLLNRHVDQSNATTSTTNPDSPALQETLKLLFNVTSGAPSHGPSFTSAIRPLFQLLKQLPPFSPPLKPPTGLIVNALANIDFDETSEQDPDFDSGLDKLINLLSAAVTTYSPTELETSVVPLLTTLRNINVKAGPEARAKLKQRILPDDRERDQPLGKSSSLASHLLRLTTSTGLTNLSEAISGLMFELSDKDASQYVHNIGYGYAAGYLMTHKIPIPENVKTTTTPQQGGSIGRHEDGESSRTVPVNPITGQRLDAETPVQVPEMSREEAEREAERLFVLFERLKATGVANVTNPVQQAMEEGRLQELSDSDDSD
ncbi:uncharacterized protein PV06_05836 [Exophiala oligosperma]|uniref:Guanine nucleotide exchange factor synembryn n=1 Tax=Exophiala oligosperma TaxID=215243 RepID=A0A0D2DGX3_9EURO|nr:uncharacterized protein PV06_05836 [Exophiala oligosperma]KIW42273.1 hypothetical protein PV06_05836 [Exophiala oligosperma]